MRKLFVLSMVAVMALFFAGVTLAPEKAAAAAKTAEGDIVSIDAVTKTLVVKTADKELSFSVSDEKALTGLKAGDKVSVPYEEGPEGHLTAKSVVKAKAAAKGK